MAQPLRLAEASRSATADEIWSAYPRREGKGGRSGGLARIIQAIAKIASERDMSTAEAADWLLTKVRRYADSPKVKKCRQLFKQTGDNYIPLPSTWFYQERYDDDESAWGYEPSKPAWMIERAKAERRFAAIGWAVGEINTIGTDDPARTYRAAAIIDHLPRALRTEPEITTMLARVGLELDAEANVRLRLPG